MFFDQEVHGLLVSPGDPAKLTAAIVRLLQDEEKRQRISTGNRKYAEANFDISIISNQLGILFDEVLDQ